MNNLIKKIIGIFTLILINLNCINAEEVFNDALKYDSNVTLNDVYSVAENYIPNYLMDSFKEYTVMENENESKYFAIQILSIGYWESGWKITKSKINKDGSYDVGYMMLNTKNISNERFMDIYGPDKNTSNDLETYLIVCINFYKELYGRYETDAVYAYNCGEGRYIRNKIPKSTYIYKQRVKECVDKFNKEIKNASDERIRKEKFLKSLERFMPKTMIVCSIVDSKTYVQKNNQMIFYKNYLFILNKDEDDHIYEKLSEYSNKENEDYVFIGQIKRGDLIRPVFYCKLNGRKYIC